MYVYTTTHQYTCILKYAGIHHNYTVQVYTGIHRYTPIYVHRYTPVYTDIYTSVHIGTRTTATNMDSRKVDKSIPGNLKPILG